jgi:hypothetical protein
MTTTSYLQNEKDFYMSKDECVASLKSKQQTNPRYKQFTQRVFHAGDEEQFQKYRDQTNGDICIPRISLEKNLFRDQPFREWEKYENIGAPAILNTFRYIFHKFKKGIFVKIRNNELKVFLPFSKVKFENEWSDRIKVDPKKYGNINDFLRMISTLQGYRFNPKKVNGDVSGWYGNNCLVRYEYPLSEGDSNVSSMKNMFKELCDNRRVPDIEFFVNRRDFPLLTIDGTEAYNNIWDSKDKKLVSHDYEKYAPVLSMSNSDRYADIMIPTWDDWSRVQSFDGKWFPKTCKKYNDSFETQWDKKKPTAVFRGGTTGCGISINTNKRLKISYISSQTKTPTGKIPLLDAGITNWNIRPRKIEGEPYLQTINIKELPFGLSTRLSPTEQSGYKYIVHIEGHVAAFRLSLELSMGSLLLMVDSNWKLWYSDMLEPYRHYIPVKADMSDLLDKIKWCRENDDECKKIAKTGKEFYKKYLQRDGVLDYLQKMVVDIKDEVGIYIYNTLTPIQAQVEQENKELELLDYPNTTKTVMDISEIPATGRTFGLLQGLHWVVNMVNLQSNFLRHAVKGDQIFNNKLSTITKYTMAGFTFAVKSSIDITKKQEHIHQTFIGVKEINNLLRHIPNFMYTFGMYKQGDSYNVITEYIHGETLFEYIKSNNFVFTDYVLIIMQICLALQVAQNTCGFIHWDLTPWNIIIQKVSKPVTFDYVIAHDKIYRIKSTLIPVIIDYGKSHVIHNDMHYGFTQPFKTSTVQDVITILLTTINQISIDKRLEQSDFSYMLKLVNFISNTEYRRDTFKSAKDLKTFLKNARGYSKLIMSNKFSLEEKTPMDLISHIYKNIKRRFQFGKVETYKSTMDKGNGRQVFEFILSGTVKERANTYFNVFTRIKHCSIPQPDNLFFVYYAAQKLEENLISVRDSMMYFLDKFNIVDPRYENIFKDSIRFIKKIYQEKIDTMKEDSVEYILSHRFEDIKESTYDETTFLKPRVVKNLISEVKDIDFSEYKDIIEQILINNGTYKLKEKDRLYYLKNFADLLKTNSLYMKTNTANVKTLRILSQKIYTSDNNYVKNIKRIGDCKTVNDMETVYESILKILK